VLRKLTLLRARTEARRRHRQAIAARRGQLPSTSELVESVDTGRRLAESVLRLSEPYRTTVLLRYYHDVSSAEIARRQDVPAGTVRWRLKRGLDELRERLDEEYEDRRTWCLAFLGFGEAREIGEGALGVGASLAWLLPVGALGAGAAVLTFGAWRAERGSPPAPLAWTGAVPAAREPGAAPMATTRTAAPAPAARERRVPVLAFLEHDGTPLAGAAVRLVDGAGEIQRQDTDARGALTFLDGTAGGEYYVERPGAYIHHGAVEFGAEPVVVELPRGAEVSGRVLVDGAAPREPIPLRLPLDGPYFDGRYPEVARGMRDPRRAFTATGSGGRFAFHGLGRDWSGSIELPRQYGLVGRPRAGRDGARVHLDAPRTGLTLQLEALPCAFGRVLDFDRKTPLRGVRVELRCRWVDGVETLSLVPADHAGDFWSLIDEERSARSELREAVVCFWVTGDRREWRARREVAFAAHELDWSRAPHLRAGELFFAEPRRVSLLVLAAGGEPIPGAVAYDADGGPISPPADQRGATSVAVAGERGARVRIAAVGFAARELELDEPEEQEGGAIEVTLEPVNLLSLQLSTAAGGAPRQVRVEVAAEPSPFLAGDPFELERDTGSCGKYEAQRSAPSRGVFCFSPDADGRLDLQALRAAPITLRVRNYLDEVLEEVVLEPLHGKERRAREIEVAGPLNTLALVALDEEDRPLAGVRLEIDTGQEAPAQVARTAGDARIVIESIRSQAVSINASHLACAKAFFGPLPIDPAGALHELRLERGHTLVVEVVDANGDPVSGAEVGAAELDGTLRWEGEQAAPGRFEITNLPARSVEVVVTRGAEVWRRAHDPLEPVLRMVVPR